MLLKLITHTKLILKIVRWTSELDHSSLRSIFKNKKCSWFQLQFFSRQFKLWQYTEVLFWHQETQPDACRIIIVLKIPNILGINHTPTHPYLWSLIRRHEFTNLIELDDWKKMQFINLNFPLAQVHFKFSGKCRRKKETQFIGKFSGFQHKKHWMNFNLTEICLMNANDKFGDVNWWLEKNILKIELQEKNIEMAWSASCYWFDLTFDNSTDIFFILSVVAL